MTDLLLIARYVFRRQQAYSVGLANALRTGDVADIASGFQKIVSTRKLSLFKVEPIFTSSIRMHGPDAFYRNPVLLQRRISFLC